MGPWQKSILVFLGAGLGADARFWLGGWIAAKWGTTFPWGTMVVNVSGSLLIGAVIAWSLSSTVHPGWRLFLAIGLLGGYTTFSSFSHETLELLHARSNWAALWNVLLSCGLSVIGTAIGLAAMRSWLKSA